MKRLIPLILLAIAFGCKPEPKPENPGNGDNNNNDQEETAIVSLNSIIVEGSYDFAEDAGEKKIPVSLQPSIGKVSRDVEVSCQQDGNLDYSLLDDGIMVTPRKKGKAVFTLSPLKGPAEVKSFTVNVLDKTPELVSVTVKSTGDNYSDGALLVSENGKGQLEATVLNEFGNAAIEDLSWEVTSGSDVISVEASTGVVTALKPGSAGVKVTVVSKPKLTATGKVKVVPNPTSISIVGHAYSDDIVEEIKAGGSMSLDVKVVPSGANQALSIGLTSESGSNSSCVLSFTTTPNGEYTRVTVRFNNVPDIKYHGIVIKAKGDEKVSRTCKFYCFDYFGKELKVGDYVYRSSDKTKYRAEDCGRRTKDGQFIGGKAKTPPTVSGYEYIGVIASLDISPYEDFLKASMLSEVSDFNLQRKSGFRKSNLVGFENFSGKHALVIAKNHSNPMKWQETPSCIAQDNSVNTYKLNSLCGELAFSQDQLNSSIGTTYVKYGFLSSLIIRRYNGLQTDANKKVAPMTYITELDPGFEPTENSTGKSATGWFIPGKGEFEFITDYSWAESLKNNLSDSWDIKSTNQIYWLIEETAANSVYDAFISTDIYGVIKARFENVSKNPSASQPRVRPMLYL